MTATATPAPHRGRGRPAIGGRVEIRIPADTLAAIDDAAAELGMTRPAYIREVLEEAARHR